MSMIDRVDDTVPTTVSDLPATMAEVIGSEDQNARHPIRELVDDRLLDELAARSRDEAGGLRLTGDGSMLGDLVKAVLERALEAGPTAQLGYDRHAADGYRSGDSRNGKIAKTVRTGVGPGR
jgi:putative transposase